MKKVVSLVLILLLFITGCSVKKVDELTEQEKISKEFEILEDNKFVYANIDEVLDIFRQGTGVILIANSDDEASKKAASILYKVSKKSEIKQIYYYNPKVDKTKKIKKYKELKKIISDYLVIENKEYKIKMPDIYSIKDGKILNHCNYFSDANQLSEEKLTKVKLKKIEKEYLNLLNYKES